MINKVKIICKVCKKEFLIWPYRLKKDVRYCSQKCHYKDGPSIKAKEKMSLAREGKYKGKNHPQWKGGRINDGKGYILILQPKHPYAMKSGYIDEHRLIMEKKIGRYLHKWEIIHHINEIANDNRIENLELLSENRHPSFHNIGRKKISQDNLQEAKQLRKLGWTFRKLGQKYGVHRETMGGYLCRL